MLKILDSFFAQDRTKLVFDHLRNLLMCTLLLAAGQFQLEQPVGVFADSTLQRFLGYGVVGMALILIRRGRNVIIQSLLARVGSGIEPI